jgi:hypothetical protein
MLLGDAARYDCTGGDSDKARHQCVFNQILSRPLPPKSSRRRRNPGAKLNRGASSLREAPFHTDPSDGFDGFPEVHLLILLSASAFATWPHALGFWINPSLNLEAFSG